MTLLRAADIAWTQVGARREAHLAGDRAAQFGVVLLDLPPGAASSERHWHSAEDEFALVLAGTPTLVDDAGPQRLAPGDAIGWRAGVPNGHCLRNEGDAPARVLVVGSRVSGDRCTYPDLGQAQINEDTTWRVEDAAGRVLRGGALPPHLLDLPPRWGITDAPAPPPLVRAGTARIDRPSPQVAARMGAYTAHLLSDTAGLTQFGAFIEVLEPGARSSDRHWHEAEDEALYVLSGTPTLVEDRRHALSAGDACLWKAGVPTGHQLVNDGDKSCSYLVVGTRLPADCVHYSDIDKLYRRSADGRVLRTRRDGSPLEAA